MGRTHWNPQIGGQENAKSGGCLSTNTINWLQLRNLLAHGPDNPPAAAQGAQSNSGVGAQNNPERYSKFADQAPRQIEDWR